ncbi:MAG: hypothetical protein E7168_01305 [Firmicutes bacterium]|nr:hypothetical protein [Bacillota bacterium]
MNLKQELREYITQNLIGMEADKGIVFKKANYIQFEEACLLDYEDINNFINQEKNENKFQKLLFQHIDNKKIKDSDVYNKVNIDRRLFSKIRNDYNYHPSKETVILLAIALELSEDELLDLLNSASYSLPKNNIFDLIIRFCFQKRIYDINKINELLFDYNCKTLN